MGDQFKELEDSHIQFIQQQHLFFVGTAAAQGLVNISPKGMDSLRVVNSTRIIWLNLTGSGNETAAHVQENSRMTVMFCSYEKQPMILRLYGEAELIYPRDEKWSELISTFPEYTGARQIFDLNISFVQKSCGFAVPYYEYQGERETLSHWADKRGRDGIQDYWKEKNTQSLDGKNTGVIDDC